MSQAQQRRNVAAWPAAERDWYLNLVAQADGDFGTVDEPSTALQRYEALPFDRCIILAGNRQDRVLDTNGALWSDDSNGRWFESRPKPLVWLHQRIGWLARGDEQLVEEGWVASHICGFCNCIRAEHIKYQSVREDRLDRAYHKAAGRGNIRPKHVPKHLVIESPVSVMQ